MHSLFETWIPVRHYSIHQSENGEFFITACSTFKTIQDLVAHYQQDADGLCINLKEPCAIPLTAVDVLGLPIDTEWQIPRKK